MLHGPPIFKILSWRIILNLIGNTWNQSLDSISLWFLSVALWASVSISKSPFMMRSASIYRTSVFCWELCMTGGWFQHEVSSCEGFPPRVNGECPCRQAARKHRADFPWQGLPVLCELRGGSLRVLRGITELAFEPGEGERCSSGRGGVVRKSGLMFE